MNKDSYAYNKILIMDVDIKQGRLKRVRRNGLVNGVNPQQSLSWIYTLFDIVIAYMFAFEFEYTGMKVLIFSFRNSN